MTIKKMRKWITFLIRRRKAIYTAYAFLIAFMIFASIMGKTTFDLFEFLPPDAPSIKGTQIMQSSGKSISSLWVMMPIEPKEEAMCLKQTIQQYSFVDHVFWMDDVSNPYIPLFMQEKSIQDHFIASGKTLLEIQLSSAITRDEVYKAIQTIENLLPPQAILGGEPLIIAELRKVMGYQPRYFLMIAMGAIFLLLTLSLRSWKKPLIILFSMGVSIIIAIGLASLFQSMSTITRALVPAILMGITLDYALFFIHRLEEYQRFGESFLDSMTHALAKTFKPVSISAITTITGLSTLLLMVFGMGPDLGLALIRGVGASWVVNLTLLPCLVYSTSTLWKPAKSISSRKVMPAFSIKAFKRILLILFPMILVFTSVVAFHGIQGDYYISNRKQFRDHTPFMQSTKKIEEAFGSKEMAFAVYRSLNNRVEEQWRSRLIQLSSVENVTTYSSLVNPSIPDFMVPEIVKKQFFANEHRKAIIFFKNSVDHPQTWADLEQIEIINQEVFSEAYISGPVGLERDVKRILDKDLMRVTLWTILLIALVILVSFKSLWLAFLLVGGVQLAIWGNLGLSHIMGTSLYQLTPIFISAIQMGATVDYGILFITRYQEEKQKHKEGWVALYNAWQQSFPTIFTSALILFSATFGIAFISSLATASQIAWLLGRGALLSFVLVMFFLPCWLYMGHSIKRSRV